MRRAVAAGMGPCARRGLKLDFDTAVPDRAPPVSGTKLQAFNDKLEQRVKLAIQLVMDGVPKDQLVSGLETENVGLQSKFGKARARPPLRGKPAVQAVERWRITVDVIPVIPKEKAHGMDETGVRRNLPEL